MPCGALHEPSFDHDSLSNRLVKGTYVLFPILRFYVGAGEPGLPTLCRDSSPGPWTLRHREDSRIPVLTRPTEREPRQLHPLRSRMLLCFRPRLRRQSLPDSELQLSCGAQSGQFPLQQCGLAPERITTNWIRSPPVIFHAV